MNNSLDTIRIADIFLGNTVPLMRRIGFFTTPTFRVRRHRATFC